MALIKCNFYSHILGIATSIDVILPQSTQMQISRGHNSFNARYPTLYLLHGLSDDHTIWQRRTSIERYAETLGIAIVMPAVNRSFYTDMKNGYRYWTYISEELPEVARSFFPLSDAREDNFVAGNSMGGYGAMKLGLRCPDKFAAAASLSGVMDISWVQASHKEEFGWIFGDLNMSKEDNNDLYWLIEKVANSDGPKPRLYQCCGTEDFLYQYNVQFRNFVTKFPFDYTYEEESGTHEWGYWDKKIQRVLEWLPLREPDKSKS